MSDIFVSYSRSDSRTANRLAAELQDHGWSVFIDVKTDDGARWDEVLEQELEAARAVVVLWSERSVKSHFVKDEAALARDRRKLFPARIEDVKLPLGFGQIQTSELVGWQGEAQHPRLLRLIAALEHRLGRPEVEAPKVSTDSVGAPELETPPQTPPQPEVRPKAATQPKQPPATPERVPCVSAIPTLAGPKSELDPPDPLPPVDGMGRLKAAGFAVGVAVLFSAIWGISSALLNKPSQPADMPYTALKEGPPPPGKIHRFRDCDHDSCPWMVEVPAGSFLMGSPSGEEGRGDDEGPQRAVIIAQPFDVSETEITRSQFAHFALEAKYKKNPFCNWDDKAFIQTSAHPAVCISWKDAKAYAVWMTKRTGHTYRLLSEAEWEYSARAGTTQRFGPGDNRAELCVSAQIYCPTVTSLGTAEVTHYRANAFGLYGMLGNAQEWVQDCWHNGYEGATDDGSVWERDCPDSMRRVLRGGGWISAPEGARVAARDSAAADYRNYYTGFRLARAVSPSAP